jgi:hypothetical protein
MKIEYNNLYTHFIFSTLHRMSLITEKHRERIKKYMTGIVNNTTPPACGGTNPEHVRFLVSRSPKLSEEQLASIVAESSQSFINKINFAVVNLRGKNLPVPFQYRSRMLIPPEAGPKNPANKVIR